MTKTLVLIRHAHRDTTYRAADNGLSDKGKKQAASLLKYYLKAFPAEECEALPRIFSSPKRRCTETVAPIAKEAGVRVEVSDEFVEQRPDEDQAAFRRRAQRFIDKWIADKSTGLTLVCSHGDWLPAVLEAATGARAELKKGAWAEVVLGERGKPRLEWLIQGFKNRAGS